MNNPGKTANSTLSGRIRKTSGPNIRYRLFDMSTATTTVGQEFDEAHQDLMGVAYGIALDALDERLPHVRQRERFAAVSARYERASREMGFRQ